jgi:hypothetical protein
MMADSLTIGKRQLRAACDAWQSGGTLALGLWLSRHKAHFTVKDYSELVEMVRAETGDTTDYSKE